MNDQDPTTNAEPVKGTWVVRLAEANGRRSFTTGASNEAETSQLASVGGVHGFVAGLLHNRKELAAELGLDRSKSEAAAIVAAYQRWGEALPVRLEGVFAVVVWDEEAETLLAVRDALGSYPLFYAEGGGDLYVSNSIDTLLVQPGVSDTVNLFALADHLGHRMPCLDETYFESVHRVPPGHVLRVNRAGRRVWRYWDPAPSGRIDWIEAEELERFDSIFEQSVNRCLSHGQAGIFLSGGLDSVSVAAVAATSCRREGHSDPLALSLAFPDPDSNEESRQRAVAATLDLPQVVLALRDAVGPEGLIRAALDVSAVSPAPLLNLWSPAYDRLALEGKARGCTTILTGGGGDEWLNVSPYYAADLMRALDWQGLYNLFHEHRRSYRVPSLLYLRNLMWRFGARPLLEDGVKTVLARSPSLLTKLRARRIRSATPKWLAPDPRLRQVLLQRNLEARTTSSLGVKRGYGRGYPRTYVDVMRSGLDHPVVAMELEEFSEQGRRLGLGITQPFWDSALVEFLYRTPPELLNRGGRTKGLVRDTVARRFPRLGFDTQRKVTALGFARSLIVEEGRHVWGELGGATALADAGVVDAPALGERLHRILRDPQSRRFHVVWDVLTLECWLRARQ